MTQKNNPFAPLDAEEAKLMAEIERDEWIEADKAEQKRLSKELQEAAGYTNRKSKPISIRLRNPVLASIKSRAQESGVPYQVIISALAEQYVQGKIKLEI
jgi:predicted DNA binding CopG/RHH family protein